MVTSPSDTMLARWHAHRRRQQAALAIVLVVGVAIGRTLR